MSSEFERATKLMSDKATLEAQNHNLRFWIGYIEYRAKDKWVGATGEYIRVDFENILKRIKEDIDQNHYHI